MHTFLRIVMTGALAVGCGDNSDDRPDIGTTSKNICQEIAEVACYNLFHCCTLGEREGYLEVRERPEHHECLDDVEIRCRRDLGDLDYAVAQGHINFDGNAMDLCLHALLAPEETCIAVGPTTPWQAACEDVAARTWIGTVAAGGECYLSTECAGTDVYCAPDLRCRARPVAGMPCGAGCASTAYCNSSGICQARLPAGSMCNGYYECAEGLVCDFSTQSGRCTELRSGGQPCTSGFQCKSGVCLPGVCQGTNYACFTSDQCPGVPCLGDIVCAIEHVSADYCYDAVTQLPFP